MPACLPRILADLFNNSPGAAAKISEPLTLRLKIMANLNISERRLPQDGRFNIKIRDQDFDVRISIMPNQHGESIVMRMLNQSHYFSNLDALSMNGKMVSDIRRLIHSPNGLFLVTGPTGSGKTTTLYSVLSELNHSQTKIITVEDPVEYRMDRINQIQVEPKIDLNFSRVLRAALRQDPDVIMVGEIRDQETAEIAMRASLTGHLVFATLHTNDAASTAIRLLDMGNKGYVVSGSLRAILSQRLVRKICNQCKTLHDLSFQEKEWLTGLGEENFDFFYGKGCDYCYQTGYQGRIGVFELLEIDEEMSSALRRESTDDFVRVAKEKSQTLIEHALKIAHGGNTSLSEVFRISGEIV